VPGRPASGHLAQVVTHRPLYGVPITFGPRFLRRKLMEWLSFGWSSSFCLKSAQSSRSPCVQLSPAGGPTWWRSGRYA